MSYLLNLAYLLVLLLASPWLLWQAWKKGKYRAGFAQKFLGRVPIRSGDKPCVWLHAVSVGEVNLLAPLIKELSARRPDLHLVVSTTSRAGYELALRKYAGQTVFYCPLDFSWAVRTALRRVRPTLLVLAELELWPNLIRAAGEAGARVAVVNGRLSERSFRRYQWLRPLVGRLLRRIDLLATQNAEYAARFAALGARQEAVHVTGSLKYDGASTDRFNSATAKLRRLAGITERDTVFLAGSTQAPEEQLAIEAYQSLGKGQNVRLIVVPRHPERFDEVAELLEQSGLRWRRRSELDPQLSGQALTYPSDWQALLVDTIGELGAWWGTARIAFVGGSLGTRGGQNMIEPAAYGAAICFGPNTWNFRDVTQSLLAAGAAVVIRDGTELSAFVRRCLNEPAFADGLGTRAASFVAANLGATARTLDLLLPLLPQSATTQRAAA